MKKILLLTLLLLYSCSDDIIFENGENENNITHTKTILSIGDSLTAGYSLDEEYAYPSQLEDILISNGYNYEVINAGISGETSSQLKSRVQIYESISPEIVILVTGGNDGLRVLSTDTLENNLEEIIDYFNSIGSIVVVGGMDIPANLGRTYRDDFIGVYKRLRDREDIYSINFFLEGVAGSSRYNLPDQIHPNRDGYEIIANNVYEFLENNNLITK